MSRLRFRRTSGRIGVVPKGSRVYRALAILVVGAVTAATAALIAAIALISRKEPAKPPAGDPE
jgi:hypothetical protein